jgi:glycosyltransferase involved in cell wall biosynthesis
MSAPTQIPDTFVLIPTVNRPHYLETALESVARQTAIGRIKEVRVMENGGDRRSETLCSRFADRLPIRYIFRQPCLTPLEHGRLLINEPFAGRYLSILHDDDWWGPEHLGSSLSALEAHGAIACYSAFFDVDGERSPLACDGSLMFWIGSGFQPVTRDWVLDLSSVLVSNLAGTPGRYSTIVAEAEVFRESASAMLDLDNRFDNDRMLTVELGRRGKVVYIPVPNAFIRAHPGQDGRTFSQKEMLEHLLRTTVWIFEVAKKSRVDLIKEFETRLDACPEAHRKAAYNRLTMPFLYRLLRKHPRLPKALLDYWTRLEKAGRPAQPEPARELAASQV